MEGIILNSLSINPYRNLALEEYLLKTCRIHQKPILYLWQNVDTVVVGRNQNLFTECNMRFLQEKKILPARRITGGGAVYHDLGNVNYTIITTRDQYNIEKNTEIIIDVLKECGLDAFKNGRNDICTPKGKISGNAYYSDEFVGLQHGTILYQADVATMESALLISEEKLSKRGIKSVKARVCDVISQTSNIEISDIKRKIVHYFLNSYRIEEYTNYIDIEESEINGLCNKYSSNEWIEGKFKEYSLSKKTCFSWGETEISILLIGKSVSEIEIYTDCIDLAFVARIRKELHRCIERQTQGNFPKINLSDDICVEYNDWIIEIDNFLRHIFLEIGINYVDERM